jgi:hypothetical protein
MYVQRLALLGLLFTATPAAAEQECYNVRVDMTPADDLQIVVWLETVDGTYLDTLFITAKTGFYGLGNRPGRMDFNSGPIPRPEAGVTDLWPYGRRVGTFPIWAHRHGLTWPEVVFQDGFENNLSHSVADSSFEYSPPYCRPTSSDNNQQCWFGDKDKMVWDTGTCASPTRTDKGMLSPDRVSLYPPRADLSTRQVEDHEDVLQFAELNPFDAVTHPTPKAGEPFAVSWTVPENLPAGDYVVWAEVSKAFDFNASYNETLFPPPVVSYKECGLPYRGQPSVVYRVPTKISATRDVQMTLQYAGYGDVNGETGTLHAPDATITSDTPGSGALRLQLVSDNGDMYRMRVTSVKQVDYAFPDTPTDLVLRDATATRATFDFIEPGDDGQVGPVARYEVRVMANGDITEDNFAQATPVLVDVMPVEPGHLTELEVSGLLPETDYSIAVRAVDDCYKRSPIVTTRFTSGPREVGSVDACFIATAAYGSLMANDVSMLRNFRDSLLAKTVLGELAVQTYYTFGPAMAGVIGESDVLRATARAVLTPIIDRVRTLTD